MFCSNCGKTLKADLAKCPHCGAPIGESRFEGQPYTGAQARIKPGEAVRLPSNHTRTTYMGSAPDMEGDVETRTTYRATNEGAAPVYEEERLYNAEDPELLPEEAPVIDIEDDADYLTPENAAAEPTSAPETAEIASAEDEEEDDDYDFDREEREEEERLRAERKAEKKARREARRAERQRREAEREALEDEELGEPIDEDEEEEEKPRRSRRRRRAEEADQAQESADTADELAELRAREIEAARPAGFSEDVNRYMNERRTEYEEKKKRAEEKNAGKKKSLGGWFARKKAKPEEDDAFDLDEADLEAEDGFESPAESFAKEDQEQYGEEAEGSDDFAAEAEEYAPEEEAQYVSDDDDLVFTSENPNVDDDFSDVDLTFDDEEDFMDEETLERRRKVFQMLKYAVLAAVAVAIIVGVTTLLSNISRDSQKSQIPNVSTALFEEGVELMQSRVGDDYIGSRLKLYDSGNSSTLVAVSEAMTRDLDSLSELLPENPDLNDQRFINALMAIQEDINNCLTNDILASGDTTKTNDVKLSESDARWATVRAKVSTLAAATDKAQLDAIIKGERIEVIQQTTPEPVATSTPEPYTKLSKGSKGEAVVKLQQRLTTLGYMNSEIDGDYGNKTKTAVQLFQKAAGLETTGIADVETQQRLFAPDAPMKGN